MTDTVQLMEPPRQHPERAQSRRKRAILRKFCVGLVFFILVSFTSLAIFAGSITNALAMLGLGAGYVKDRVCQTPPFGGKKQVHLLLIGVDVPDQGSSRTDTIKFITADFEKQRISMLSIPRDTWVTLPNGDHGRINSAHQLGGNNRTECVKMVETAVGTLMTDLSGQPIKFDGYVRIHTHRFVALVDALGGIDIDVEKAMKYSDPSQKLFIDLKPGFQHLDGYQAMGYVRFRHDAEGDYARMRRQDKFINAVVAQMSQPERKKQMGRLVGPLMKLVATDISLNDARALKQLMDKVGMSGVQTAQLPTVPTYKGAASVVEVEDPLAARQTICEVLYGPRPTVAVLNGTPQGGLAREVSERISTDSYNIVGLGTTDEPVATSVVFADKRLKDEATRIAAQIGLTCTVDTTAPPPPASFMKEATPVTPPQITVILGDDYRTKIAARSQLN